MDVQVNSDHKERRENIKKNLFQKIESGIRYTRQPLEKQIKLRMKVRNSQINYLFLQYDYLIKKWVYDNYNIKEKDLNILLYIYPISIFSTTQFKEMQSEIDINDQFLFKRMIEDRWILLYTTQNRTKYYVTSSKANRLIDKIHKLYLLEDTFPMNYNSNTAVKDKSAKGRRLMELFKDFNKKVKNKD